MHIEGLPITFSAKGQSRLPSTIVSSFSSMMQKIALDTPLEIDQHRRDLLPRQIRSAERSHVIAVHLFADFPPGDADITRCVLQPYNFFESSIEFAYQRP